MDNQHRQIRGYRELTQQEIGLINEIKRLEQQALEAVAQAQALIKSQTATASEGELASVNARHATAEPGRWASIAKTDIQQGFMALVRAVAQPV